VQRVILMLFGSLIAAAFTAPASAQDYPNRPMTVIGTTPGGTSVDLTTRFFGERVKEKTGQPWVVENKPGAQGSIAAKAAASAKPDGYTMFLCTSGAMSANQYLQKDLPYNAEKDFKLVARMFRLDFTLMVNPEKTPVKTVAELTAFLKNKPGRVSYGYFSASMQALAEQYLHLIGIPGSSAAYKNPAQMMTELEAGDFDFSFTSAEYALLPNSKLRPLAIGSEKRSALLPDVPTMVEAGFANALPLYSWFGLCVPSATPEVVVNTLAPIILDIAKRDETRAFLKTYAGESFPGDAKAFAETVAETSKDWSYFVKLAKIDAQ
jgi:tripartite-type tricarboxylate transporter receptor subunit TctC